jgi:hypothetical protein
MKKKAQLSTSPGIYGAKKGESICAAGVEKFWTHLSSLVKSVGEA